ncbi:hypothetical protein AQPE_2487 [Aquipluma nitroreducens]|uniref:Uncharacterized protein n=1 Tax=Aquipluma nitroreducens TaxID=2010828 RepID=A0A5K7S9Z8_9BACT|nr:hypothetical protein AQPE_2487 [Aquipluma nitroreducens]
MSHILLFYAEKLKLSNLCESETLKVLKKFFRSKEVPRKF